MKKTFNITLNTEITIDFSSWGLSDAQQRGGLETKCLLINHYLEKCGFDEFDVSEKNSDSLFEVMAEVVKVQNDYALGTS